MYFKLILYLFNIDMEVVLICWYENSEYECILKGVRKYVYEDKFYFFKRLFVYDKFYVV